MIKRYRMYGVVVLLVAAVLTAVGCARYERKVVPFKMAEGYPNATPVAGAVIAAEAFDDTKRAQDAFGFDIRGAGILPVQVVFDNRGNHALEIDAKKTYLVDSDNNLWPILDASLAYDRIEQKTEYGEIVPEGSKKALLLGTAGAIIGAAIGIVSGENVGDAAMKGAAVGAAAGATIGGAGGYGDRTVRRQISEDLHSRSLEQKPVPPREIAHGFIFFPGEASKAQELRLTIIEQDSGVRHAVIMGF